MGEMNGNLKVGVIGGGMIGGATVRQLELSPIVEEITVHDKGVESSTPAALEGSYVIFICVSSFAKDLSAVDDAVENAAAHSDRVIIRSTIPPGQTRKYMEHYPARYFCFMPEFFRERSRIEDALHPDKLIFGVDDPNPLGDECLSLFEHLDSKATMVISTVGAEMVKLAINAYYTTKIVLANQLYDVASAYGVPWEEVKAGVYADERIDPTGFDVLLDEFRGAGGKCFPKEIDTLIEAGNRVSVEVSMLTKIAEVNNGLLGRKDEIAGGGRSS